ncbi:hypothetical protein L596_016780 [Steinernema carpocapsae]|uniref:Uncharacterized protein n=1 Tax=Steinernema carpocapsae TaxID=34508 RepID=A0A4U5NKD6_STECR|nr:hypothetical protein L596_016780 [Steinernema carpocapsae]
MPTLLFHFSVAFAFLASAASLQLPKYAQAAQITCDSCPSFPSWIAADSQRITAFLNGVAYNRNGYKNCSQRENVKLVREFLYELILYLADKLMIANPRLPTDQRFHITCPLQHELQHQFQSLVTRLSINYGISFNCGCPAQPQLTTLYGFCQSMLTAIDGRA